MESNIVSIVLYSKGTLFDSEIWLIKKQNSVINMFMEYAMSNWHNGTLSSPEVMTKIFFVISYGKKKNKNKREGLFGYMKYGGRVYIKEIVWDVWPFVLWGMSLQMNIPCQTLTSLNLERG